MFSFFQNKNVSSIREVAARDFLADASYRDTFLIDVREPSEWAGELGHAAEANLVSLGNLSQKLSDFPKDKTIAVVCRSGARSMKGCQVLEQAGFSKIINVGGGMMAWNQAGGKVVR